MCLLDVTSGSFLLRNPLIAGDAVFKVLCRGKTREAPNEKLRAKILEEQRVMSFCNCLLRERRAQVGTSL